MRKMKPMKAWADVGSHGGIFEFAIGNIADRYPHLLQIYSKQVTPDLIPVKIIPIKQKN